MQLKNNKGFSLPEITVALGLVAGISLVTIKMMENQANNEAMIKGSAEIQKATARIKAAMADKENCRFMLSGKTIGAYASPQPITTALYSRIRNHAAGTYSQVELVVPNAKYQGFKTSGISLRYPQSGMTNVAEVVITYRLETKSILFDDRDDTNDRKTIRQVIPVIVKQAANVISDCGPAVSDTNVAAKEKFCLSLGALARWYPATQECKFEEVKCGYGTVPEYQNSTGTVNCVSIENQLSPTDLFSTATCPIGASRNFTVQSVGGKLQVRCL